MKSRRSTRWFWALALAAVGVISIAARRAAPVKVMFIGDSITYGIAYNFRAQLWTMLADSGYANFEFVGSNNVHGYWGEYDMGHEGYGGKRADQVVGFSANGISTHQPDVAVIHLGTNDYWQQVQGKAKWDCSEYDNDDARPEKNAQEIGQIIDNLQAANPSVKIIIVKFMIPYSFQCWRDAFWGEVESIAAAKTTASSEISFCDVRDGWYYDDRHQGNPKHPTFDTDGRDYMTQGNDFTHPNTYGAQVLAAALYGSITPYLDAPGAPRDNAHTDPASLAQGKEATASNVDGPYVPSRAVDGDLYTSWLTTSKAAGEWLKVDLGSPQHVGGTAIYWYTNGVPIGYCIDVSEDGENWTRAVNNYKNTTKLAIPFRGSYDAVNADNVRYIRVSSIDIRNGAIPESGAKIGITEFRVFAEPVNDPASDITPSGDMNRIVNYVNGLGAPIEPSGEGTTGDPGAGDPGSGDPGTGDPGSGDPGSVPTGDNLVANGDFAADKQYWSLNAEGGSATASMEVIDGELKVTISGANTGGDVKLLHFFWESGKDAELIAGKTYQLVFDAYADQNWNVTPQVGNWTKWEGYTVGTTKRTIVCEPFTYESGNMIQLWLGNENGTITIDNVQLIAEGAGDPGTGDPGTGDPGTGDPGTGDPGTGDPGATPSGENLIANGDFSADKQFWSLNTDGGAATAAAEVVNGELQVTISGANTGGDVKLLHFFWESGKEADLVAGAQYQLAFDAYADKSWNITPQVGNWTKWEGYTVGTSKTTVVTEAFTYESGNMMQLWLGNENGTITLDNIRLVAAGNLPVSTQAPATRAVARIAITHGGVALTVDQTQRVTVDVINAAGRQMAVLYNGTLSAGTHIMPTGNLLPHGCFLLRVRDRKGIAVRQMTVTR